MNKITKKVFLLILMICFILFNIFHILFPVSLIIEDINNGTMISTSLELGALYPWIIEILSIPFVIAEIVVLLIFIRVKYNSVANLFFFFFYIFQVILFNILLVL